MSSEHARTHNLEELISAFNIIIGEEALHEYLKIKVVTVEY